MGILTKEERQNWLAADAMYVAMEPQECVAFILRALDTIDALEIERVRECDECYGAGEVDDEDE